MPAKLSFALPILTPSFMDTIGHLTLTHKGVVANLHMPRPGHYGCPEWHMNREPLDGCFEIHWTLQVTVGPIKVKEKEMAELGRSGAKGLSVPSDKLPQGLKRAIKRVPCLAPYYDLLKA